VLGDGGQRIAAAADERRETLFLAADDQGHRAVAKGQVVEGLVGLAGQTDRPHAELA